MCSSLGSGGDRAAVNSPDGAGHLTADTQEQP